MKTRILCIDDEAEVRRGLRMLLEYEGYECLFADNGPEGIAIVERDSPDLVFLDLKMPGMDGMDVLKELRTRVPTLPVVIMSGHGTIATAVEATRQGAFDFVEKFPSSDRLLIVVRNALAQKRLRDENERLKVSADERYQIVGESAALQRVLRAVRKAAPIPATVLISGESGVGKELVAWAIHRQSPRKGSEFVHVNCAAIPEDLIESELFGHEKGSFVGAADTQIGKFERAHKGTIFLDEVGDMSLRTQSKVLRVLQNGELERIGSQKTLHVDVRVIAATNKNLEELMGKGAFRQDLYYRLSVFPIQVPPLRERTEDIELLVNHFAARFCDAHGLRRPTFSSAVLATLGRQPWRGNVRELKNMVERLLILKETEETSDIESVANNLFGPTASASLPKDTATIGRAASRRVFVVHGHDDAARETVARFLEKISLEPVILSEAVSGGKTIIEKIEHHGDVGFAIVLLTPDDEGRRRTKGEPARSRARQNVIAELGYFVGKLKRDRVCLLRKGDVEWPSDFAGVVYIEMDDRREWRIALARELRAAGMAVDIEKLF